MRTLNFVGVAALTFVAAQFGFSAPASAQCTNSCATAHDGECDDGGAGSLYSICTLGTDCGDCGPRGGTVTGGSLCTNNCSTASDGECDDGGPGSLYSICSLGTDCNDCGPRVADEAVQVQVPGTACTNTCSTANDGECDDGGPGSLYSICTLGTDCNDCGSRSTGGTEVQQVVAGSICSNSCGSANDAECDDGGPNSLYSICTYGSDCNDCGARTAIAGCSNTCASSNDNECDDGGPGSMYSICDLGTDCSDCGAR